MKTIVTLLILFTLFSLNTFAQDYTQLNLPEGAKVRLGKGWIGDIAYSPDGTRLAVAGSIGIWLYDTATHQEIALLTGHTDWVRSVSFSPDGRTLASGSYQEIRLWDGVTGSHLRTLTGHTHWVWSVSFSPDGRTLASGSYDDTIRLWDGVTGSHLRTLTGHTDGVESVSFSPDGRTLASGSWDGSIRLWDGVTGAHLRTLTGHTDNVRSVTFSPDGRTLASGSSDDTIRLWDAVTGAHQRTLTGHTDSVLSVSFSPDGRTLASGSYDDTIRLWDGVTGVHLRTLTGHTGSVYSVSFSPDGRLLASGSWDGTVLLWELTPSTTTDTTVRVSPATVSSPAIGEQLTLSLDIADGENVAGYQVTVGFDTSALRYVESANGDFLPAGAFFVPPVVSGNSVALAATSLSGESYGDGTLATLTFEVIAVKGSTLTLSDVVLSDSGGTGFHPAVENGEVVEPAELTGDVNGDGVVNIQDLVLVAGRLGQTGQNDADMNGDGVVNIQDLVLVAGALGNTAAAPSVHPQVLAMFTAADVQGWLTQAQGLHLTDATLQRGIIFLENLLAMLTPKETALLPNYPNPFNPETWIPYHLSHAADVTLTIYDTKGVPVRQLDLGYQPAGYYTARSKAAYWDGCNADGESVASGVYFYQLRAGDYSALRRMVIVK